MQKNTKFLIYKGSGGIAHNLYGLSAAIQMCETQNRSLIIDMKNHPAFKIKFSEIFNIKNLNIKYYDSYDIIDPTTVCKINNKNVTITDIANSGLTFDDKTLEYSLLGEIVSTRYKNPQKDIVIHAGYKKYNSKDYQIQINDSILKKLLQEKLITEPYISLHFRNTDKKNNINPFIDKITSILATTKINTIYIASDFYEAYDIISKKFPRCKVIRKTIPAQGIKNLHYSDKNKYDEIYECIRDIYYVAHSTYFIPSINSGLSTLMINQINKINPLIPNINSTAQIMQL